MFNSIQQRYIDSYVFKSFKDFIIVINFFFVWSWHEEMKVFSGESVCSLQCSGSTSSLPSKIDHHLSHKVQE